MSVHNHTPITGYTPYQQTRIDGLTKTIDRQAKRIERLRRAVVPFLNVGVHFDHPGSCHKNSDKYSVWVTVGDIYDLRAALAKSESGVGPKVTVQLPGDITVHLTGADATEFMEQRGIQDAEPGSDVEDEPVAPAGG